MENKDKKNILEVPLEKSNKKLITILVVTIILVVIAIFVILIYFYLQTSEHKMNLGANIEEVKLSQEKDVVYIKLVGGINEGGITKIKFVFKDKEGGEYYYETTKGTQEINVPFKRSFWDWLAGKPKYEGIYDYEINSNEIGLENFENIEEVSVSFEYKTETGDINETGIITSANITKIPTCNDKIKNGDETGIDCGGSCKACGQGGGGGGGGGGGSETTTPPCTPESKETTCGSWVCGIKKNNCNEDVDCGSCRNGACENGICISNFCLGINNCDDYTDETNCTSDSCNIGICKWNATDCVIREECDYIINSGESINKYSNVVQPGETVCIRAGTYNGTLTVQNSGTPRNLITFKAYPGEECQGKYGGTKNNCQVVLDGQNTIPIGIQTYPHNYIRIEGFEIKDYTWTETIYISDYYDYLSGINVTNIEVVNNYIHDNVGAGTNARGRNCNGLLIENNEIYNNGFSAILGAGSNSIIRGNNIHHNVKDGIDGGGNNVLVEYNKIYDQFHTEAHQDGLDLGNIKNWTIRYNIIYDLTQLMFLHTDGPEGNENLEIYGNILYSDGYAKQGSNSPGIFIGNGKNISVHSNTCGWLGGTHCIRIYGDVENLSIRNNIIYDSSVDVEINDMSQVTSDYNLYGGSRGDLGAVTPPTYEGSHSMTTDPHFVNYQKYVSYDFHLKETSPAIDKGDPSLASVFNLPSPFVDIDRNSRPQGAGYDIGAYEYVEGPKTYYVSQLDSNCDDSGPGTSEEPWCNLNRSYTWYSGTGLKVQEGDTVYFRNGSYGQFKQGTPTSESSVSRRSNWITYKAESGHTPVLSNVFISGEDKWSPIEHGKSYYVFKGFDISNGVSIEYTSNIKLLNCKIHRQPNNITGYFEPYFNTGAYCVGMRGGVNITIQGCDIYECYRGIRSITNDANLIIADNIFHHISEDGFSVPSCNGLTITGNTIYDLRPHTTAMRVIGTKSGTFTAGETVTMPPDAVGIAGSTGSNYVDVYAITGPNDFYHYWLADKSRILTGPNGTVNPVTDVDQEHCDGFQIHGPATNILIKNNYINREIKVGIGTSGGQGFKLAGSPSKIQMENNLIVAGAPCLITGTSDFNMVNNTIIGIGHQIYGAECRVYNDQSVDTIIDNMGNNIISRLTQSGDDNGAIVWIKNHGDNIFHYTNTGGPSHPFVVNETEINGVSITAMNAMFVDANYSTNGDFHPLINSVACNGSINPPGVAVGALPCVCTNNSQCEEVFGEDYICENEKCVESVSVKKTSSISQFGITWTFDKEYKYGIFANGDYWVVGPVTVIDITPGWDGEKHGSMINPDPGNRDSKGEYVYQAFDSRLGNFNSSLLVQAPVTLSTNSSLVSVISWIIGEPGCPPIVGGKPRPTLKTAAVLTVLGSAPPNNGAMVFRPPYSGNKKPLYSIFAVFSNKNILPNLSITSDIQENLPTLMQQSQNESFSTSVERGFQRVWLDLGHHGDLEQYFSPTENMPAYGADISRLVGDASLLLMLDEQELINQTGTNKDTLLIRFAQVGIDNYGVAENGGTWWGNGGLGKGRKWPILFTGLMLNHSGMKDIGITSPTMKYEGFAEDCNTFYVDHIYNNYNKDDIGLPEWGGEHCFNLGADNKNWSASYRGCCTAKGWAGFVLAAHIIMNAKELWNHDTLFDYQDRYMEIQKFLGSTARSASKFAENMWDTYRANYSCIWTRDNKSDLYSLGHYNCSNCLHNCLQSPYCGDGSCNGQETSESCEWDCGSIVPSFSPFAKLWNWLKSLLTAKTGNAITGKAITENAVSESKIVKEKEESFFEKIINFLKNIKK